MSLPQPYHHGDLSNALLAAALDILEQNGLAALSLRAISAKAGVSHAAPAHHFRNLRGLLTALVTHAFARFTQAMAQERAAAHGTPIEQMRAAGRGYIAFAHQNPALFRLMFSSTQLDSDDPSLCEHRHLAYRQLTEISHPAAEQLGIKTDAGRAEIANLVWTTTHGYAHLMVEGQLPGGAPGSSPAPPDIAAVLFGLAAQPENK